MSWLDDLKVGDRVARELSHGADGVCTVSKLTAAYVFTDDGYKWHRKGNRAGFIVGMSAWSYLKLLGPPEYVVEQREGEEAYDFLRGLLTRSFSRGQCKLTTDQLRRMAAIARENE